jgi:hypothetical protein
VPEQAADLGYRELLFICQVAIIMPMLITVTLRMIYLLVAY